MASITMMNVHPHLQQDAVGGTRASRDASRLLLRPQMDTDQRVKRI